MGTTAGVLILIAAALIAIPALLRWQELWRIYRGNKWIRAFLIQRYGALPNNLSITGFEDFLCPVIVRFDHPDTGVRHRMQFSCQGATSTFDLRSERAEPR